MDTASKNTRKISNNRFYEIVYRTMKPLGLSYAISYIIKYRKRHSIINFAGNLVDIKKVYHSCDDAEKAGLTRQFESIVDALVLKNGVRKTTYSSRQNTALASVCEKKYHFIHKESISVLDIPSSVGLSSIDIFNMLADHFSIGGYTLADQYFEVFYDKANGCIYDDTGNLLQVKLKNSFYSIYRPHTAGDAFGIMAFIFLLPLSLVSYFFKRKYSFSNTPALSKLLLMHPDAEKLVKDGTFSYQKSDIFSKIEGQYDLILSFNLLQKNYFSEDLIDNGIGNLTDALAEGGLLVMGNTESFSISLKQGNKLILLESVGEF